MKLEVLQENLNKSLTAVSRIVSTKVQLPVLNNVLLTTDQGRLKLSATNLETGINFWVGAKIEKKGQACIPVKVLAEFVSSLPAEKVLLASQESSLKIVCGSYQAEFVGLPASEFPSIPTLKTKPTLIIDNLIAAVPQVAFAAAQDESRPVLTGVFLKALGNDLLLVATDGYRLSRKKIASVKGLEKIKEFKKGLIIPHWALNEAVRIVGEKEDDKIGLNISPQSNQIIFSVDEAEVISRLIEGEFPEFEKIIPQKGNTKLTVEKEILLRAVKMASIFARESANIVKFEIQNSTPNGGQAKFEISANAAQVGSNISEIEIKMEGKENKIAFNSRYLLDFLNSVEAEQISFEMSTPLNPGVFKPVGDKTFLHIIMPVRIQE